jgi:hypothetical protein
MNILVSDAKNAFRNVARSRQVCIEWLWKHYLLLST